ncbi:hypothetical protein H6G00_17920 [Leptolyngbya sp. FACHB-541]|uniref:hypothetical protein n=1 Tax=Leptolyngbya sp. FACHB-541 TaxID=2692810 RepID=UPI001682E6F4|nr:hypothetical protein [Leptolyngbya sp. FACHB-541]MBD1998482.1 hypothetical protein [Leptolyngbya sp. FACHB-541]
MVVRLLWFGSLSLIARFLTYISQPNRPDSLDDCREALWIKQQSLIGVRKNSTVA